MSEKMDRRKISFGSPEQMEAQDSKFWKESSVREKVQTITYLRECFYGLEATTGRLQRVFKFIKQT